MGEPNDTRFLPSDAEGLFQRGVALYQRGDVDAAINALEAATTADPMHAHAWCYLGLVQLALDNSNEAVIAFGSSIKATGMNPEAYIGLGFALARQGDEETSVNCFKQAMLLTMFDVESWIFVGEFLTATNIVEAEFCFSSALNIDPNDRDAQQGMKNLFSNTGASFVPGDTVISREGAPGQDDFDDTGQAHKNKVHTIDVDDEEDDADTDVIDERADDADVDDIDDDIDDDEEDEDDEE
jgi:tetratricopeptide (TPR) repeat protein